VNDSCAHTPPWKLWLAAVALLLPVATLYAAHYVHAWAAGQVPTGFIHYDMAGYLANAREHFDDGRFALIYGNAASPRADTPRIYFQPMTLLLGGVLWLTGADPGAVFAVFGLIAGLVAVRLAIAVFEELFGLETPAERIGLVCFVWGGGLMVLAGTAFGLLSGGQPGTSLFRFDPGDGWWFLNFGRNLVYPTEALYHALALGCLLALIRRRFAAAVALLVALSASHPFTGIQIIAIVFAWLTVEWLMRWTTHRSRQAPRHSRHAPPDGIPHAEREVYGDVPWWTLAATALLAAAHLGYYLVFLPRFEEHAALVEQWRLPAPLEWSQILVAYGLAAALVVWRCRGLGRCREVFADPRNRLLAAWFVVSFLLANHDWFLPAHQPLHFTRGYLWMPLFLLGAPALIGVVGRCGGGKGQRQRAGAGEKASVDGGPWSGVGTWLLVGVFLLDNAVWFAVHCMRPTGVYLHPEERMVLKWVGEEVPADALIVSDPPSLAYLATVYTPHRAWFSHWANTPYAEERKDDLQEYLETGAVPDEWHGRDVVILAAKRGRLQPLFEVAARRRPKLGTVYRSGEVDVWYDRSLAAH